MLQHSIAGSFHRLKVEGEFVYEIARRKHDDVVRWSLETGQVAKRVSRLGAAGWPKVRHGEYTQETRV